jgi:hypothetical protein
MSFERFLNPRDTAVSQSDKHPPSVPRIGEPLHKAHVLKQLQPTQCRSRWTRCANRHAADRLIITVFMRLIKVQKDVPCRADSKPFKAKHPVDVATCSINLPRRSNKRIRVRRCEHVTMFKGSKFARRFLQASSQCLVLVTFWHGRLRRGYFISVESVIKIHLSLHRKASRYTGFCPRTGKISGWPLRLIVRLTD